MNIRINIISKIKSTGADQCLSWAGDATRAQLPRRIEANKLRFTITGLGSLVAVTVVGLATQTCLAQGWYTVDDFQYSSGLLSAACALAKDPTGTIIYAAGQGYDAVQIGHALALKSSDGGTNWSVMDDYVDSTGNASYLGIAVDPAGNIYASDGGDASVGGIWATRRSTDGGVTWSTVDTLISASAIAIASDKTGNVYVAGFLSHNPIVRIGTGGTSWATVALPLRSVGKFSGSGWVVAIFCHPTAGVFVVGSQLAPKQPSKTSATYAWTVWRSQNGGRSWATVDTFQLNWQNMSYAEGGGFDNAGNIYIVGKAVGGSGALGLSWQWIARKSADGGNTWSIVDDFVPQSAPDVYGFGSDIYGNLFVAGTLNSGPWLVRESTGGTGSWNTVDTFQYPSGNSSYLQPNAVIGDSSGHIYVAGYGEDALGVNHWLVRRH